MTEPSKIKILFKWLVFVLGFSIVIYAIIQYGIIGLVNSGFYFVKVFYYKEKLSYIWDTMILIHIIGSSISLLIGPFLFIKKLRRKKVTVHRYLGYTYVAGILIGGISGFYTALYSTGGIISHFGFGILAILWIYTGLMVTYFAIKGEKYLHRAWAIRSYSLTFVAVTLRLWLGLFALIFGGEAYASYYVVISWLCWVPNLIIAWFYTAPLIKMGKIYAK
ncbi:DUF2306 domain-containing protein [Lysinibacillus capsici]|uniref:DUF2306 domain-containing protein n=1 Tax=Lysinibacillus capsici TaxID=2115968 RepID=A0ABY8KEZ6_9BACI|nr:DUF2306 domain-containing protein [Lysinibacillus capsici]MCR6523672.1 DUF2306 domain-containing protein [Lysinibacillus capsici]WGF37462.1 DUF2306 domain-containing protein [Lysinibacillus capsici]